MAKKKSKYNPSLLRPSTKVNYPHSAEREYYRVLRALVRAMVKATKESLVLLKSQWNVRHDETESERVINAVKVMLEKAGYKKAALDELLRIRANADSTVKANIARAFRDVLAVDVFISETDTFVKVTDEWFNQQSKLVDSIVGQYTDKLGTIISNGVQRGTMYSEVAEEIKKLYKTTDSRAKFIARNEISNLNAITTKVRQEDAGIKVYEWSSSEDERVRPEHAFYDGKLFYWNNHKMGELNGVKVYPTPKYHPGMDYNCRCVALPIIDAEAYDPKTIIPMAKPEPKPSKVLQKSDSSGKIEERFKLALQLHARKKYQQIWLPRAEFGMVISNFRTHITKEQRFNEEIIVKCIRNHVYTAINDKEGGFIIVDKKPIDKDVDDLWSDDNDE